MINIDKQDDKIIYKHPDTLTQEQAMQQQKEWGYDPAGYGFWGHTVTEEYTTWESSKSCD